MPGVAQEVAFALIENLEDQLEEKCQRDGVKRGKTLFLYEEVLKVLDLVDLKLFKILRDKELTLEQVRAKLDQIHYQVQYKVIDDFKPLFEPHIFQSLTTSSKGMEKQLKKIEQNYRDVQHVKQEKVKREEKVGNLKQTEIERIQARARRVALKVWTKIDHNHISKIKREDGDLLVIAESKTDCPHWKELINLIEKVISYEDARNTFFNQKSHNNQRDKSSKQRKQREMTRVEEEAEKARLRLCERYLRQCILRLILFDSLSNFVHRQRIREVKEIKEGDIQKDKNSDLRQFYFLRRMELDLARKDPNSKAKVIWNQDLKSLFELMDRQTQCQIMVRLGLLNQKEITADGQVRERANQKPRPQDLIAGRVRYTRHGLEYLEATKNWENYSASDLFHTNSSRIHISTSQQSMIEGGEQDVQQVNTEKSEIKRGNQAIDLQEESLGERKESEEGEMSLQGGMGGGVQEMYQIESSQQDKSVKPPSEHNRFFSNNQTPSPPFIFNSPTSSSPNYSDQNSKKRIVRITKPQPHSRKQQIFKPLQLASRQRHQKKDDIQNYSIHQVDFQDDQIDKNRKSRNVDSQIPTEKVIDFSPEACSQVKRRNSYSDQKEMSEKESKVKQRVIMEIYYDPKTQPQNSSPVMSVLGDLQSRNMKFSSNKSSSPQNNIQTINQTSINQTTQPDLVFKVMAFQTKLFDKSTGVSQVPPPIPEIETPRDFKTRGPVICSLELNVDRKQNKAGLKGQKRLKSAKQVGMVPEQVDFFELVKNQKIDFKQVNEETLKYLNSPSQQLFSPRDHQFLVNTLSGFQSGGLLQIQSTKPTQRIHQVVKQQETLRRNDCLGIQNKSQVCIDMQNQPLSSQRCFQIHRLPNTSSTGWDNKDLGNNLKKNDSRGEDSDRDLLSSGGREVSHLTYPHRMEGDTDTQGDSKIITKEVESNSQAEGQKQGNRQILAKSARFHPSVGITYHSSKPHLGFNQETESEKIQRQFNPFKVLDKAWIEKGIEQNSKNKFDEQSGGNSQERERLDSQGQTNFTRTVSGGWGGHKEWIESKTYQLRSIPTNPSLLNSLKFTSPRLSTHNNHIRLDSTKSSKQPQNGFPVRRGGKRLLDNYRRNQGQKRGKSKEIEKIDEGKIADHYINLQESVQESNQDDPLQNRYSIQQSLKQESYSQKPTISVKKKGTDLNNLIDCELVEYSTSTKRNADIEQKPRLRTCAGKRIYPSTDRLMQTKILNKDLSQSQKYLSQDKFRLSSLLIKQTSSLRLFKEVTKSIDNHTNPNLNNQASLNPKLKDPPIDTRFKNRLQSAVTQHSRKSIKNIPVKTDRVFEFLETYNLNTEPQVVSKGAIIYNRKSQIKHQKSLKVQVGDFQEDEKSVGRYINQYIPISQTARSNDKYFVKKHITYNKNVYGINPPNQTIFSQMLTKKEQIQQTSPEIQSFSESRDSLRLGV